MECATRKGRNRAKICVGLLLVAGLSCGGQPEPVPERIILIVVDTLRADHVGAYGGDVSTPSMDRLAASGQVLPHAVASFHQTTMSMGAMFTGRTPSIETGDRAVTLPWNGQTFCGLARFAAAAEVACVPASLNTLAEDLQGAGFLTIGVVSNGLLFAPYGFEQGFDQWHEVGPPRSEALVYRSPETAAASAAREVNGVAREALAGHADDSFFLYLHYIDVHDWALSPSEPAYVPSVERFDTELGRLLDWLEDGGFLEGATVLLTADHGEALGEAHAVPGLPRHFGNPSFETLLRVPLIVSPPRVADADRTLRSEDIPGLIKEIAGIHRDELSDLDSDELLVTEMFFQTYRSGRWKSIWPRDSDQVHLFDLETDPAESRDVAADHPEVLARHRERVTLLTARLAGDRELSSEMTDEDQRRLRALGYIQ